MLDFLPDEIKSVCARVVGLEEVRVRSGLPVFVKNSKGFFPIGITASGEDVQSSVLKLVKHSAYAFEESIKNGFITTENGERVGLCGSVVGGEKVTGIKNITSLCIRIPSNKRGCSKKLTSNLFYGVEIKSTVIIAPPGAGKTTFLRDVATDMSVEYKKNVLIVDEKNEIAAGNTFLGYTTDVMRGVKKSFGTEFGVKNLRPDVVVVDELLTDEEFDAVEKTSASGVVVFASVHGKNLSDYLKKRKGKSVIFENFAVLSLAKGAGTLEEYGKIGGRNISIGERDISIDKVNIPFVERDNSIGKVDNLIDGQKQ